jgi:hypothetical protein
MSAGQRHWHAHVTSTRASCLRPHGLIAEPTWPVVRPSTYTRQSAWHPPPAPNIVALLTYIPLHRSSAPEIQLTDPSPPAVRAGGLGFIFREHPSVPTRKSRFLFQQLSAPHPCPYHSRLAHSLTRGSAVRGDRSFFLNDGVHAVRVDVQVDHLSIFQTTC